jgi:hypothetical protein
LKLLNRGCGKQRVGGRNWQEFRASAGSGAMRQGTNLFCLSYQVEIRYRQLPSTRTARSWAPRCPEIPRHYGNRMIDQRSLRTGRRVEQAEGEPSCETWQVANGRCGSTDRATRRSSVWRVRLWADHHSIAKSGSMSAGSRLSAAIATDGIEGFSVPGGPRQKQVTCACRFSRRIIS